MVQNIFLLVFVGRVSSRRKTMADHVEFTVEVRNIYIDVVDKKLKGKNPNGIAGRRLGLSTYN